MMNFAACRIQNHRETQRVGNDRRWIDAKSSSLMAAIKSAEPCSSLLTLAAINS